MQRILPPWPICPALALLATSACSERGASLDEQADTESDTSDGSDDESTGEPEPERCAPAWTESVVPDDAALGVFPVLIAPVQSGGFYLYGLVLRDQSVHLWIGAHDPDGTRTSAIEVDTAWSLETRLWSMDTDAAGNLVAIGDVEPIDGGAAVPTVVRYQPDGTQTWRLVLDETIELNFGRVGVAAAPAGAIAISATLRVADDDTDAWIARLDPITGAITWSASWSGPFEGGWSTDHGGPVAIRDDGRVLALALVRHDYQTHESTLLAYDGQDPSPLWSATVIDDPGPNHEQTPTAIAFGPEGLALTSVEIGTLSTNTSVVSAFDSGIQRWSFRPGELDWTVGREFSRARLELDADGSVAIVGAFSHEDLTPEAGVGTFVVHVDEAGTVGCHLQIGESDEYRQPTAAARIGGLTVTAGPTPWNLQQPITGPGWMTAIVP